MSSRSIAGGGDQRGLTLIDLQVVIALIAILGGITVVTVQSALTIARGDNAMVQVAGALRQARDIAIAQRRSVEVQIVPPNQIHLLRNDIPEGQTTLAEVILGHGAVFELDASLPDTPDGFGNGAAIDFGDAETIEFLPDGILVDEAGLPVNGTVFVTLPGERVSARAITVTGGSGRAQTYRWLGTRWEVQ